MPVGLGLILLENFQNPSSDALGSAAGGATHGISSVRRAPCELPH